MLLQILLTLAPMMALVGIGAGLFRFGLLDQSHRSMLERLVYWVCLPSLLVIRIAEAGTIDVSILWVILAFAAVTLAAAGLAGLWWYLQGRPNGTLGVVIQGGFRGNLAFVGLPVIDLAGADTRTLAIAALTLGPIVAFYNVLAVLALAWSDNHHNGTPATLMTNVLQSIRSLVTNPLIIACVLGLLMGLSGLAEIRPLAQTLTLLGQPAAPLALMSLGGALVVYKIRSRLSLALGVTTIKLAVCPALAIGLAWFLNLDEQQAFALILLAACPTAVASYVLVTQFKSDQGLAATIIAMTTLASPVSLGIGLIVLKGWGG
ncbi:AEC family transporter [Mucisphaera sp.]|uniref:AEC family transporter n=1 Tax=Mucisphaera sp. TaxID=2913024 RepID=UPI003D148F20